MFCHHHYYHFGTCSNSVATYINVSEVGDSSVFCAFCSFWLQQYSIVSLWVFLIFQTVLIITRQVLMISYRLLKTDWRTWLKREMSWRGSRRTLVSVRYFCISVFSLPWVWHGSHVIFYKRILRVFSHLRGLVQLRLGYVSPLATVGLVRSEHSNCSRVWTKSNSPRPVWGGGLFLVPNELWSSLLGVWTWSTPAQSRDLLIDLEPQRVTRY